MATENTNYADYNHEVVATLQSAVSEGTLDDYEDKKTQPLAFDTVITIHPKAERGEVWMNAVYRDGEADICYSAIAKVKVTSPANLRLSYVEVNSYCSRQNTGSQGVTLDLTSPDVDAAAALRDTVAYLAALANKDPLAARLVLSALIE